MHLSYLQEEKTVLLYLVQHHWEEKYEHISFQRCVPQEA